MTSGKTEKEKEKERLEIEAAAEQAKLAKNSQEKSTETKPPRTLESDDKDAKQGDFDSLEFYKKWAEEYKKKNPDFDEDKNKMDGNCLCFQDPQAEEDFVRELAKQCPHGGICDKGIKIADFKNGELIDMRTQKPFPEGGYADLVSQLDNGVLYENTTIKSAEGKMEMSAPNRSSSVSTIAIPETPQQTTSQSEVSDAGEKLDKQVGANKT